MTLLSPPTSGEIIFDGQKITNGKVNYKKIYREMQMVFQDPDSSLDPRLKVRQSVAEPCKGLLGREEDANINALVMSSLTAVGLTQEHADRIPSHLSGG